ncbi:MAG: hypothetical protein KA198_10965 [Chitinophagaceae bacterium]|nr:hypothetical protein [Chitinophagaceae bacterium]
MFVNSTYFTRGLFVVCSTFIGIALLGFASKFTYHAPCSFSISLPSSWRIQAMEEEHSIEYCDYFGMLSNGDTVLRIHSTTKGRFPFSTVQQAYQHALKNNKLRVSYRTQKNNWFVVSGQDPDTQHVVYWKTIVGPAYVSELIIDYPQIHKQKIESVLPTIADSFKSN